jgi:hypothetical protein
MCAEAHGAPYKAAPRTARDASIVGRASEDGLRRLAERIDSDCLKMSAIEH